MTAPLVRIEDLRVVFKGAPNVHAVNGVSLDLAPGEVLGILGESGSGKSVTLKTCCVSSRSCGARSRAGSRSTAATS